MPVLIVSPKDSNLTARPQLWRSFGALPGPLWSPSRRSKMRHRALKSAFSAPWHAGPNRPGGAPTVAFVTLLSREWRRREGRPCRSLAFNKKRPGEIALCRASLAARTGGIPAATLYVLSAGLRVNMLQKKNAAVAKLRTFLVMRENL
jgi:hypothetical protein